MVDNIIVKPLSRQTNNTELTQLLLQLTDDVAQIDVDFLIEEEDCYCCGVRHNNTLIGFGVLSTHLVPTKGFVGTIEDVIIDRKYRNQGIGTAIVEHLLQKAQNPKLFCVNLTSAPHRIYAHKIYIKLGFQKVDTNLFRKFL